jgi:WD40 repeat protein
MPVEGNLPSTAARQRGGRLVAAALVAIVIAICAFSAGWMMGARRTLFTTVSPDGKRVAYVTEGRCAEVRCQALRIADNPGRRSPKTIEALTGDEEVSEIAWTPDSRRVAFVVNGYQLRVFDAQSGQNLGAVSLIDPDGFPPSRIARGITFSGNGAAVTFDDCPRGHSGCKAGILALKLSQ